MTIFTFYVYKSPLMFCNNPPILFKEELVISVDEFSTDEEKADAQDRFDTARKHIELTHGKILLVTQNYVGEYTPTTPVEYIFDGEMKNL